jgi:hypothetical protein
MHGSGYAVCLLAAAPVSAKQQGQPDPLGALALLLMVPLALGVFTALELVLWVLAAAPLAATCRAIERGRGRCLLTGLGAAAVILALLALFSRFPAVGKSAAPLLVGITGLGCLTGVSAVASLVGQGALDLGGWNGSRGLSVLLGAPLLGLMVLFPIVGQVLGVYLLLVGLGGAVQALARTILRRK